ncbi:MAG: T9SS type A sorting domain-containing protein, partial [Paludibacteraceae bacterium]
YNMGMQFMTAMDFKKNRFVPMGGKLYYINRRNELCVTDGTSAGTSMVADIHPTDTTKYYGVKTILAASSTKIFFVGNNGVNGFELWISDGTTGGTQMVNDIVPGLPGFSSSSPNQHVGTIINEKLYFFAKDATNGYEPWVSDGTAAGTFMLANTNPTGDCSSGMASGFGGYAASEMKFFEFNNAVYFIGYSGIYKTDGTTAGTTLEISGFSYGANFNTSMCVFDNRLYFNKYVGGLHILTKTDGTVAGTNQVDTLSGSMSRGFQEFNGELYFRCKPNSYSSSDKDYLAKLTGSQIDKVTATTSGYYNYSVNMIQPISNSDFLYMGSYYNHAIYRYNNGANTIANTNFTSVFDNLLSTPIGTFAIGTNATYGYELWKWDNAASGIETTTTEIDISVYPNPTNNVLKIDSKAIIAKIEILDTNGLLVKVVKGQATTIDVSNLTEGYYLIKFVTDDNRSIVKKIIKNQSVKNLQQQHFETDNRFIYR